ncbi:hypothetical protein F5884DRAFT_868256 [Xylogone sp. PMI_703]|nr:hypothetical protein F5884DRAFT_868256 [Xylogone sp. PMI_703]
MMIVWAQNQNSSAEPQSSNAFDSSSSKSSASDQDDSLPVDCDVVPIPGVLSQESQGNATLARRIRLSSTFNKRSISKRNHKCTMCPHIFARAEHLIRHERLHRNEKPFCCDHCEAQFSRKDLKKRHMLKYHPELSTVSDLSSTSTLHDSAQLATANWAPNLGTKQQNTAAHASTSNVSLISHISDLLPAHTFPTSDYLSPPSNESHRESGKGILQPSEELSQHILRQEQNHDPESIQEPLLSHLEANFSLSPLDLDSFLDDMSFRLERPLVSVWGIVSRP